MKTKRGIVLAGGGARGAYQIGVLLAFEEAGLLENISAISGASIGSLNAVLLAAGDLQKARDVWTNLDEKRVLVKEKSFLRSLFEHSGNLVQTGYYDSEPIRKTIEEVLDVEAVINHDVYAAITHAGDETSGFLDLLSVNWRQAFGKKALSRYVLLRELDKKGIVDTLLASCAIPIIFRPVVVNGETHYDGGVLDRTPWKPLYDAGCDEIFLIDLFRFRMKRHRFPSDVTIYHIKPSRGLRGILDFRPDLNRMRIETGYRDGQAFVKRYHESEHTSH